MSTMNFIDISGWQKGLNLETVFSKNPALDGVIVKATGGSSYVQATCDPWVQELIRLGKPWGFYHFLDDDRRDAGGKTEAEFFVKNCQNYFGAGVPVADYEGRAKDAMGVRSYLLPFLETVYSLTGIRCMVYTSLSTIQEQDLSEVAAKGYPLWLAQYGSMNQTGIQESPWQKGSVAPFSKFWMHQYSSNGRLSGYDGALDLDKFYGNRVDWDRLVAGVQETVSAGTETPTFKDVTPQIVRDILNGLYGTGTERHQRLEAEGWDYDQVQSKINELYRQAETIKKLKNETGGYFDLLLKIAEI